MSRYSDLHDQIRARSQRDPDFRERLSEDPAAAISEALGIEIPGHVAVRVQEEGPHEAIIVLPAVPPPPEQLTDSQLQSTAGGWHFTDHPESNC